MVKESRIVRGILDALRERGAYATKVERAGHAGTPDILACVDGRFVALEVKVPGRLSRTTALQRWHLEKIKKAGGRAAVVTCVKEALEALGE